MTTPYEREIAVWIAERQRAEQLKRRESVAVFIGIRSDVVEAQAAGFSLKTIWSHMRETGRLKFRYETFLKYVRRHITDASSMEPQATPAKQSRKEGTGEHATRKASGDKK